MAEDARIVRDEILRNVPMRTASDLCTKLACATNSDAKLDVEILVGKQKIFRLEFNADYIYPAFQFFPTGEPRPVIERAIACLLPIYSAWDLATWFWSSNGWLGGRSPFECVETDPELVVHAAEQELAE